MERPRHFQIRDGAEAQWHDQGAARRRTVKVGGDNRRKLKRVYASEAEAKQAAQAAAGRAARALGGRQEFPPRTDGRGM